MLLFSSIVPGLHYVRKQSSGAAAMLNMCMSVRHGQDMQRSRAGLGAPKHSDPAWYHAAAPYIERLSRGRGESWETSVEQAYMAQAEGKGGLSRGRHTADIGEKAERQ